MPIIPFKSIMPVLHEKSYIAEGACVIGKVALKEFSSVWNNAVLRGDVNDIILGNYSNVQDCSVVHTDDINPAIIGDYVTIGHAAIVHGAIIEDHCLIGMGATVLSGVHIGRGSIIAAGTVVKQGMQIPPFSLVAGVPGKIIRTNPEEILKNIHAQAIKYRTIWTDWYGILPNAGGEIYNGEQIV